MIYKAHNPEVDIVGGQTLRIISEANNFNEWMYQTIKPFCKGRVLEVGSGIGNISQFFLRDNIEIVLTDMRDSYCSELEVKFGSYDNLLGIFKLDLVNADFDQEFNKHLGLYDTVFALNVLEHIYEDSLAINNCRKLLKSNGNLIILVPSFQSLYNKFDKELGHHRRYNKKSLSDVLVSEKFKIIHTQYFNFFGIFGWFFSGRILKKKNIPGNQMKIFNTLVPLFKVVDKIIFNFIGLSVISVAQK